MMRRLRRLINTLIEIMTRLLALCFLVLLFTACSSTSEQIEGNIGGWQLQAAATAIGEKKFRLSQKVLLSYLEDLKSEENKDYEKKATYFLLGCSMVGLQNFNESEVYYGKSFSVDLAYYWVETFSGDNTSIVAPDFYFLLSNDVLDFCSQELNRLLISKMYDTNYYLLIAPKVYYLASEVESFRLDTTVEFLFDINADGTVANIRMVSKDISEIVEKILTRSIKYRLYQPKVVDGDAKKVEGVKLRYFKSRGQRL